MCVHIAHFADAPAQHPHFTAAARACFTSVVAPVVVSSGKETCDGAHAEMELEAGGLYAAAVADSDG